MSAILSDKKKSALAVNLKLFRNRKGFSQDKAAELIGVKQKTYAAWEEARSEPGATLLPVIADLYETDIETLIGATYKKMAKLKDTITRNYEKAEPNVKHIVDTLLNLNR